MLEGRVTRVDWENPHVHFYLDVKDARGAVVHWVCETGGPNVLIRAGWKRDSLKPGRRVQVKAYLAKDGSNNANGQKVTFPDQQSVVTGTQSDSAPRN